MLQIYELNHDTSYSLLTGTAVTLDGIVCRTDRQQCDRVLITPHEQTSYLSPVDINVRPVIAITLPGCPTTCDGCSRQSQIVEAISPSPSIFSTSSLPSRYILPND
jgi:hypothetical protein